MPPEAKVLIIEDDSRWQDDYPRWIAPHTVVATAYHILNIPTEIERIKQNGVLVDVAIVDGNLGESDRGEDGARAIEILREELPHVKIVGVSGLREGVRGADVNMFKGEINPGKLVDIITNF